MYTKQINFQKYSSIKIGQIQDVKILEDLEDLQNELSIIGLANNLLISPTAKNIALLSSNFNYIKTQNNILIIGGATKSSSILKYCKEYDLLGFEFMSKLPGTLGGMLSMNAGVKQYEIFNSLLYIKTSHGVYEKKDIDYGYRFAKIKGVIIEAGFELNHGFNKELFLNLLKIRNNQPKEPSFGSMFKNPKGDFAGRLIEDTGLKGEGKGGATISNLHANFLVNKKKDATYEDAIYLIELIETEVYKKFKIKLQREVVVL